MRGMLQGRQEPEEEVSESKFMYNLKIESWVRVSTRTLKYGQKPDAGLKQNAANAIRHRAGALKERATSQKDVRRINNAERNMQRGLFYGKPVEVTASQAAKGNNGG